MDRGSWHYLFALSVSEFFSLSHMSFSVAAMLEHTQQATEESWRHIIECPALWKVI